MGKKKSTALMVLLTILIVVLCAITALPTFAIPGTVKIWNPAVTQYDLGADLGGGYYAYYYPTGVISENEWKELDENDQASYTNYVKDGKPTGLYLNNDPDYGIIDESEVDENENGVVDEFETEFAKATAEISARYAKKGYSDYRVAVVDDFALRIQLPASEASERLSAFESANHTFTTFAQTGEMTILLTGNEIMQLDDNKMTDIVKEFSVHTQNDMVFLKVTFTDLGKDVLDEFAYEIESAEAAKNMSTSSSSSVEDPTLVFMVGETTYIDLDAEDVENGLITPNYEVRIPLAEIEELAYVETQVILLNSALHNEEGFDIEFNAIPTNDVRTYGSLFGENTMMFLYISLFAVIVALIVFSVVAMGRFGVVGGYATASYFIVTGICFAFITGGVYEVTLGTALVFVLGLALMNAIHAYTYSAIKAEAALGKTIASSVKAGYTKTLMPTVDIYAVLLLGALALLIGAAGLQTLATQAIICIVTGAFCNLLWTRVINYTFLSASKNKNKYFRVVREDNDDE